MKKLLGLLGSIGMVVTTAATVVACGDEPNQNFDLKVAPTGTHSIDVKASLVDKYKSITVLETNKNGEPLSSDEKLLDVKFVPKQTTMTRDGSQPAPAKITVMAKEKTGKTFFRLKGIDASPKSKGEKVWFGQVFSINIEKTNIRGVRVIAYNSDTQVNIEARINAAISSKINGQKIVLNRDYTIEGLSRIVKRGTVTVKAKPDSKIIEGSFTFDVVTDTRPSIAKIVIPTTYDGEGQAGIRAKIQAEIAKVAPTATFNTDYVIAGLLSTVVGGKVTVTAKVESGKLKDSFAFEIIERKWLTDAAIPTIEIAEPKASVETKIQQAIEKLIAGAQKGVDYTISRLNEIAMPGSTITISAIVGSTKLKTPSAITLEVGKANISIIKKPTIAAGSDLDTHKETILTEIQKLPGCAEIVKNDLTFAGATHAGSRITVTPSTASGVAKLTGTISIVVEKADITKSLTSTTQGVSMQGIKDWFTDNEIKRIAGCSQITQNDLVFEGSTGAGGIITVTPSATGAAKLTGTMTITVARVDITGTAMPTIAAGTPIDDAKSAILRTIQAIRGCSEITTDDIDLAGTTRAGATITVTPSTTSGASKLTGSITITVAKAAIGAIPKPVIQPGSDIEAHKTTILNTIKGLPGCDQIQMGDLTFAGQTHAGATITVTPSTTSGTSKLTGTISIIVEKANINGVIAPTIIPGVSVDDVKQTILEKIRNLPGCSTITKTDLTVTGDVGGKINAGTELTITPSTASGASKLEGSITARVGRASISDVIVPTIPAGTTDQNAKNIILSEIQQKSGCSAISGGDITVTGEALAGETLRVTVSNAGTPKLTGTITVIVDKINIENIAPPTIVAGTNPQDHKATILTRIQAIPGGTAISTADFEVIGTTDPGSSIIVRPTSVGSAKLAGKMTININKADINAINKPTILAGSSINGHKTTILNRIKELVGCGSITADDFELIGTVNPGSSIIVRPTSAGGAKLTGTFTIIVRRADISPAVIPTIAVGSNFGTAKTSILGAIQLLTGCGSITADDLDIAGSTAAGSTITVKPSATGSTKLTGNIVIPFSKTSIAGISTIIAAAGTHFELVKTNILTHIQTLTGLSTITADDLDITGTSNAGATITVNPSARGTSKMTDSFTITVARASIAGVTPSSITVGTTPGTYMTGVWNLIKNLPGCSQITMADLVFDGSSATAGNQVTVNPSTTGAAKLIGTITIQVVA
ncbi:lipoprotein [Williamsoniiplasma luminosum]|uniref:Lipoprotein n=1 Tax=Williamsoniiplasma luminosum TaxID=214888 RepID=A0A2S0NK56_9MOLU|nr:lipoprotein [Williamsoniiplasma luminosum]AVP49391.1 MAG: hypothetical protein C5T88_02220 [Williamsoniiplasma luminosum]